MSRYARMFQRLRERGDGAFGGFLMLGDPDLPTSAMRLDLLVESGADMIEVGIPFSDPIADGPIIQAAAMRARASGVRVRDCFALIAQFRSRHADVPVGILTYANLVVGNPDFSRDAATAGADSLLVADVPSLEAKSFVEDMGRAGLEPVLIAASNTPEPALRSVASLAKAYTYCVSRAGTTGTHADAEFDAGLTARLDRLGAPPAIFGFGVSRPEHVHAALQAGAAGVICGSAIVRLTEQEQLSAFVGTMKASTRGLPR